MKITIEIPESFVVTSRDVPCDVDLTKVPTHIWHELALHGLTQKIADAASGAKALADKDGLDVAEVTSALLGKACDGLYAGEWTRRGNGGGVDAFTVEARRLVRAALKQKLDKDRYKALDDAALDKVFADNEAMFRPAVEAELARKAKEREGKAKLAASLTIDI